jgi:hypothetical protein
MSYHPLFPPEGGEPPADVQTIKVARDTAHGQDMCARLFSAEELRDEQQLLELFGGGSYELRAYGKGGLSRRRRVRLMGPRPKPMNATDDPEPAPAAETSVPSMGVGGSEDRLLVLMMQMMKMQSDSQAQSLNALATVMSAVAGRREDDGGASKTFEHLATLQSQQGQAQMQFLGTVLASMAKGGGGSDHIDTLLKGIELGRQQGGDDEEGAWMSEMAHTFMQGVQMAREDSAAGVPPPAGTVGYHPPEDSGPRVRVVDTQSEPVPEPEPGSAGGNG